MRFRLEPAPPHHVVTVLATLADGDAPRWARIRLLADDSVDAAADAIGVALGLPADADQRLVTPNRRQYGRPDRIAELGFGRRTLDARRQPLVDALAGVGALARLHRAGHVVDVEVESIATVDPAGTYPAVVTDGDGDGSSSERSNTTTERGPTS